MNLSAILNFVVIIFHVDLIKMTTPTCCVVKHRCVSGEKRMVDGGDGGRSASAHLHALSFSSYLFGTFNRTTVWSRAISHRGTAIDNKLVAKSLPSANLASRANVRSFLTKKKKKKKKKIIRKRKKLFFEYFTYSV